MCVCVCVCVCECVCECVSLKAGCCAHYVTLDSETVHRLHIRQHKSFFIDTDYHYHLIFIGNYWYAI